MKFKIEYYDPETLEEVEEHKEFFDTEEVTAWKWAEDYAYTMSDKGWYRITEEL